MGDCNHEKKIYRKISFCKNCGIIFGPNGNRGHLEINNNINTVVKQKKLNITLDIQKILIEG